MITVMGATGNTGKKIALSLIAAGHRVRALGRSEARLAELRDAGAEVVVGDSSDPGFLAHALHGADAAYTLLPTDRQTGDYAEQQRREGVAITYAIQASGVRHVVSLSSLGADLNESSGVIAGLRDQEHRLMRIDDVNVLFLRPVSFFENFYDALESIRFEGVMVDSVEPDLEIPMVATRDVADAAVTALSERDWSGIAVRELIGPRDLSYREATRILADRIGKPELEYVQLSYADMADVLVQAGLSESFAGLYVEMTRAFNEGIVVPQHGRTRDNTTPTTFEEFAGEFALAYEAAEVSAVQ